jgi:hypothetical protein
MSSRAEFFGGTLHQEVQAVHDEKDLGDNVKINYIEDNDSVLLAQDDLIEVLYNLASSEFDLQLRL